MKMDFSKMNGKIMAVVQDYKTKEVLMVGVMNKKALEKTLETGKVTFWSRTRRKLWTKGETSGNWLIAKKILVDCDVDTVLIMAKPQGPTCHTGDRSCFLDKGIERILTKEIYE
ncbi:MAG: phosphoribosyl-AMP cyclohydrolase [Candidatus Berkelbacteria bacterium]